MKAMIAVVHILFIFLLAWFYFRKSGREFPRLFWLSLGWRFAMGAALGLVYLYYYAVSDTWLFFFDANALVKFGKQDFIAYLKFLFTDQVPETLLSQLSNSQERSLFLIKIISVFCWTDGSNYWISAMWFSFISFVCAWYLFSVISRQFENAWVAASLSFLFFPSVAFWSSGLIKETLALSGLCMLSGVYLKLIFHRKLHWTEYVFAMVGFWVAWRLKYYWAAMFGAVLFTHYFVRFLIGRWPFIQRHSILVWIALFTVICGGVSVLHPNFNLHRFLEVLVDNHDQFVRISDAGGLIHFYNLEANWGSVLLNAPWALLSGIFRPFIWETDGLIKIFASSENLVLAVLMLSSFRRIHTSGSHSLLLFSVIVYITVLCIFLALSTPNFGTLSRYRVGFLPFLVFIISYQHPILNDLQHRFSARK